MSDHGYPPKSTENTASEEENSSSTGSEDGDNNWDDWVEDVQNTPAFSLFDDHQFPTAEAALTYDKETHGFDLVSVCKSLELDTHQRLRLVNYIRSERPPAADLSHLQGSEVFLSDDKYLKPAQIDDPLLQLQMNEWSSDSDEEPLGKPSGDGSKHPESQILRRKVKQLEERLAKAQRELVDYRRLVNTSISNVTSIGGIDLDEVRKEDTPKVSPRDDDTHYFESYNEQAIHYTMLTDRVRTTTYATFILSNPSLFQGAVVMDVGCGTGILSLLAARAGAKRVIAVEASKIADKAEAIFKSSGYADVITLVRSKVEDLKTLPDDITRVDVIISEWMGYALLYESMLDSVLHARDRFLKPNTTPLSSTDQPNGGRGGVMAPSQCRMMLALCDPQSLIKQHITFWNDVYGFNMSAMAAEVYDDAIVDHVPKECLLSSPSSIKDLNLQEIHPEDLLFTSEFVLKVNELPTSPAAKAKSGNVYFMGKKHDHRTFATAFVLWFDTFFHPDGKQYSPDAPCKVHTGDGDWEVSDVLKLKPSAKRRKTLDQAGGPPIVPTGAPASALVSSSPEQVTPAVDVDDQKGVSQNSPIQTGFSRADRREESFTTGPHGTPTHWKQAVFLLKDPIELKRGMEVKGNFRCWKSTENSRELDVELCFSTVDSSTSQEGETSASKEADQLTVQKFKVR